MRIALSPRIFVSYSRTDLALAEKLAADLGRRGFRVFLDLARAGSEGIDPGDNFVSRLSTELRRTTAVVAVISPAYLDSPWGRAELLYGIARGKVVIPIAVPPASITALGPPLAQLLRDVQFVTAIGPAAPPAESDLGAPLQRARVRHRSQIFTRAIAFGVPILLVGLGLWWGISRLNSLQESKRRKQMLDEVTAATTTIPATRIRTLANQAAGDPQARAEVQLLAQDRTKSDAARFSALVLAGQLATDSQPPRWYIDQLRMDHVTVQAQPIVDVTFRRAQWRDVRFRDLAMSGVVFTGGLDFSMSDVVFERVTFYGGILDSVKAIHVTFVNTKFRGSEVDVTNFAKVRFVTERPQEAGNPTITPEYSLFESSTLISHVPPPEPGVIHLGTPEDEVIFEEVHFVRCRLEGWFDPRWFRRSSFDQCVFPSSLTKEALERAGNTVL